MVLRQQPRTMIKEMQPHTYPIMRRHEDSHWWYIGRRLILESFLRRIIRNPKSEIRNPKILDVGCGTGANLEMLAKFGETIGVDVSVDALDYCHQRGFDNVRQGLAEHLPFADREFDLTTALDVIEHLDDDLAGLREMKRVLKPGGQALIFVPAFQFLWGVQDDISHHRRRYTKRQIVTQVERAGFTVTRVTYANITFFPAILAGRALMKITRFRPASENNLTLSALNPIFGQIFGAERFWLKNFNFPFGVSIVVIARKK